MYAEPTNTHTVPPAGLTEVLSVFHPAQWLTKIRDFYLEMVTFSWRLYCYLFWEHSIAWFILAFLWGVLVGKVERGKKGRRKCHWKMKNTWENRQYLEEKWNHEPWVHFLNLHKASGRYRKQKMRYNRKGTEKGRVGTKFLALEHHSFLREQLKQRKVNCWKYLAPWHNHTNWMTSCGFDLELGVKKWGTPAIAFPRPC